MSINDKISSLESFAEVTAKFNSNHNKQFRELILNFLVSNKYARKGLNKLSNLHDFIEDESLMGIENQVVDGKVSYGLTGLSKTFYSLVDDEKFKSIYINMLLYLYEIFGIDFYFQNFPTIRAHFPNEASKQSYPLFHVDGATGHPPSEINLWMPITNNKENTFTIMSYRDSLSILEEMNFNYEELNDKAYNDREFNQLCLDKSTGVDGDDSSLYVFNSLRLHSTLPAKNETRISLDTRVVPAENFDFDTQYKGGGRMGAEFWPGGRHGYNKHSISHYFK